jgi:DNA-binding transcriptional LysR family regulator
MHNMNISSFDLNLLRVFDAMMAERNVTRAARRVFLSQPATSHALARLRKEVGDPLFVRAGRAMIPTAKATALGPAVSAMLDQLALLLGNTRFDPGTSAAVFRLGIVDLAEYLLAPLFAKLMREEAPHIRFLVHGFDDSSYQAQLASGALDIAVSTPQPPAPGIHSRKISTETLVGLVRDGHPLTRRRATARQFKQVPRLAIALRVDRLEGPADRLLEKAGVAGDVVYATPYYFALPTLLANSDLLLVTGDDLARLLCVHYPLSVVQLPVRLPPIEWHIIWHERTHRDPAQRWMRDKIAEGVSQLTRQLRGRP